MCVLSRLSELLARIAMIGSTVRDLSDELELLKTRQFVQKRVNNFVSTGDETNYKQSRLVMMRISDLASN